MITYNWKKWIWAAAGPCLVMNACADMKGLNAKMNMSGMAMNGADSAFSRAMDTSMKKMDHDMASGTMTGDPDHDFAVMTIPHHQGEIDMAEVELRYGKDPCLRSLSEQIIAAQKKEIAEMNEWLSHHSDNK